MLGQDHQKKDGPGGGFSKMRNTQKKRLRVLGGRMLWGGGGGGGVSQKNKRVVSYVQPRTARSHQPNPPLEVQRYSGVNSIRKIG